MEKFRIIKKTYDSGVVVFIPQYLYDRETEWYKDVCFEMRQVINCFKTEQEAVKKIEEYKKHLKDSKVVSKEVIQINDDNFVTRLKQRINTPNEIDKIQSFANELNLSKEKENELIDILGNVIVEAYARSVINEEKSRTVNDLSFMDENKCDERSGVINDLIYIHDAVKGLSESDIESVFYLSLCHVKKDNKINIQQAIENALIGCGIIKE